jgi:hypothetical protein
MIAKHLDNKLNYADDQDRKDYSASTILAIIRQQEKLRVKTSKLLNKKKYAKYHTALTKLQSALQKKLYTYNADPLYGNQIAKALTNVAQNAWKKYTSHTKNTPKFLFFPPKHGKKGKERANTFIRNIKDVTGNWTDFGYNRTFIFLSIRDMLLKQQGGGNNQGSFRFILAEALSKQFNVSKFNISNITQTRKRLDQMALTLDISQSQLDERDQRNKEDSTNNRPKPSTS